MEASLFSFESYGISKRYGNRPRICPGKGREDYYLSARTSQKMKICLKRGKAISGGKDGERDYYRVLRMFGIGESMLETKLLDLIDNQTDPTLATYARKGNAVCE